jgi:hypothetical protein
MTQRKEMETFVEATEQLRNFAAREGLSGRLCWVFRENVVLRDRHLLIASKSIEAGEAAARVVYDDACEKDLGVELAVVAKTSENTFCTVSVFDEARVGALVPVTGLKLKVPTHVIEATVVESDAELAVARKETTAVERDYLNALMPP